MAYPTRDPLLIRTDMVARLTAALPTVGVFDSRQIDVDEDEIPAVSVYSVGCDDTNKSLQARVFERVETLGISARVTATTDAALAAAVDAMETAILAALLGDIEWNLKCPRVQTSKSLDIASNRRVGGVDVKIDVTYSPEYAVDLTGYEFETCAVTTEPTDPDGADVSEREIALEQP
jgi:hypothetical protein